MNKNSISNRGMAQYLYVIFIMYNHFPHSIVMKQPMEIGRDALRAYNSVKMCAVTHEYSHGGGGSQLTRYRGAKRAYVRYTPLLSIVL